MRIHAVVIAGALCLGVGMAPIVAHAKGCLKGAAVGGVAGHMAGHHGLLGATAGCAVGHHEANKADRAQHTEGNAPAPADHSHS